MANVNDLKDRVEIWRYTYSDNTGGTPVENFAFYRYKYANVRVAGGGTANEILGNQPYSNVVFIIRYDSVIDYKCQIKYEDVFYKINHIEVLDRNAFMKIQTVVYNQTFD